MHVLVRKAYVIRTKSILRTLSIPIERSLNFDCERLWLCNEVTLGGSSAYFMFRSPIATDLSLPKNI